MSSPEKYNILHLDDIGVGWNARKYKDDFNIFLNDVIQTFRPQNNLVLMTLQSGFLIDKVPRALAHYEIEMESANFEEGFTIAKVNRIVLKHKTGDIHYPYIFINGTKYVRHIFEKPDEKLMAEYEWIRAEQLKKLKSLPDERENKQHIKGTAFKLLAPAVLSFHEEGLTQRTIAEKVGISQGWVSQILAANGAVQ